VVDVPRNARFLVIGLRGREKESAQLPLQCGTWVLVDAVDDHDRDQRRRRCRFLGSSWVVRMPEGGGLLSAVVEGRRVMVMVHVVVIVQEGSGRENCAGGEVWRRLLSYRHCG